MSFAASRTRAGGLKATRAQGTPCVRLGSSRPLATLPGSAPPSLEAATALKKATTQRDVACAIATPSTTTTQTAEAVPAYRTELNGKYLILQRNAAAWAKSSYKDKIQVLKEIRGRLLDDMYSWGKAGAAVMGVDNDPWYRAEFTLFTAKILDDYLGDLINTFESMDREGRPPQAPTRTLANGQIVARVYPGAGAEEEPTSQGTTADLYIKPGKPATQGAVYLSNPRLGGKVAALLGAGNLGFLGAKDVLHMLFEQNNVVMFKPHPIQAEWHRYCDRLFEPLSSRGLYRSFYTDSPDETREMLMHPAVGAMHMTGGTATHDILVWGPTEEERSRRKAANDPLLKVPVTSELGCVTPWIVTPGNWTEEELEDQANKVAYVLQFNNGCACNAIKCLVLPESWPQADLFISKIKSKLVNFPLLPAFYPGHNQRYNAWKAMFPQCEVVNPGQLAPSTRSFGSAQPMPYLIQELPYPKPGEPLTEQQKYAFTVEPFAPVMSVVRVPGADTPSYLAAATEFANKTLWGTLSCTVLVHPDADRDHPEAVQQMLDKLEYGTVVVNAYSGMGYALKRSLWGAFDGDQTIHDVGSGIGHINNTLFYDHPQKVVVRAPFFNMAAKSTASMGLPVWAMGPLTGLIIGGPWGVAKALFTAK